jgi:hypothetical protein
MKKYLFLSLLLTLPTAAFAEGTETSCEEPCPESQTMVSHADGNTVVCRCTDPAEMVPTEADSSYEGAGESLDAGQTPPE